MTRSLVPALLLALLPACILVIDADDHTDAGHALASATHPGFHALVEDLADIGWEVADIDRRGNLWRYELEDGQGHEATILVRLGPGRAYTIREIRNRPDESCAALADLEELAAAD